MSVGTLFEDDGFGDLLPVNVRLRSDQRLQSDHHCREKTHTHSCFTSVHDRTDAGEHTQYDCSNDTWADFLAAFTEREEEERVTH